MVDPSDSDFLSTAEKLYLARARIALVMLNVVGVLVLTGGLAGCFTNNLYFHM